LFEFNPTIIKSQAKALHLLHSSDYSSGVIEILLSGSVGSAKSILAAHAVVKHCLENQGARVLIGRRSLPDVKATILTKISEHLEDPLGRIVEDRDYKINWSSGKVVFRNGSEIISRSWADKRFKKLRSLDLSAAVVEELTENDDQLAPAYHEIKNRVGRLSHIRKPFILSCTNPDAPSHWAYKYFILGQSPTRHVIYSKTKDNPFLPDWYYEQLRRDMDPKMRQRMLDGEWIELNQDRLYYAYDSDKQFRKTEKYKINPHLPIALNFDFNIGDGKPMSSCVFQKQNDTFHVFDEVVIEGVRTLDVMEEWAAKGLFNNKNKFLIHGDATGEARHTKSLFSDYDLIKKFLHSMNVNFEMQVPRSNPPIRTRHNRVNAYCLNDLGVTRLYLYQGCNKTDEGLRLTALKQGGQYIEDDSKDYQHITTALGYGIVYETQPFAGKISSVER
jgi:hypothetical protein